MQHDRMGEAERQLRNIELENEIRSKTRELEELERKIKEQTSNEFEYQEKDGFSREFDTRNKQEERKDTFNSSQPAPQQPIAKQKPVSKEEAKKEEPRPAPPVKP